MIFLIVFFILSYGRKNGHILSITSRGILCYKYALNLDAVPAEINRADKKQIKELEEKEANLKLESSRLKEVAEIATHQAESISFRQQVQEKELTSLRRQLHDIQMETDEKTIIGTFCFVISYVSKEVDG